MNQNRASRDDNRTGRRSGGHRGAGAPRSAGPDRFRSPGRGGPQGARRSGGERTRAGARGEFAPPVTGTPALPPVDAFDQLGLPAPLLACLTAQGVTEPFPIQAATLPNSLAGRDILGRGRTGSGKTLAFGLALLARLEGRRAE
ncbi:DEAD/DEAH box helicase, partial [Streptomyces albidoflavus]